MKKKLQIVFFADALVDLIQYVSCEKGRKGFSLNESRFPSNYTWIKVYLFGEEFRNSKLLLEGACRKKFL